MTAAYVSREEKNVAALTETLKSFTNPWYGMAEVQSLKKADSVKDCSDLADHFYSQAV